MDYSNLYYKCKRPELAHHVLPGKHRILEVGCAEGILGESLKQQGLASEVIGIELFPDAAKVAESRLDRVICGDLELIDRNETGLECESFDYIICGDVLEHLRDPWETLNWLVTLLKKGGRLITSIPNVRHWSVVLPLLIKGKWEYKSSGILDKTHLRFFTKQSALVLVLKSGLSIDKCLPLTYRKVDRIGQKVFFGSLNGLFTIQWLLICCKSKNEC